MGIISRTIIVNSYWPTSIVECHTGLSNVGQTCIKERRSKMLPRPEQFGWDFQECQGLWWDHFRIILLTTFRNPAHQFSLVGSLSHSLQVFVWIAAWLSGSIGESQQVVWWTRIFHLGELIIGKPRWTIYCLRTKVFNWWNETFPLIWITVAVSGSSKCLVMDPTYNLGASCFFSEHFPWSHQTVLNSKAYCKQDEPRSHLMEFCQSCERHKCLLFVKTWNPW